MSKIIKLSVHQLVDFLLRKGDIDDRIYNSETMEEGSKIHRNFQSKQKDNYLSEIDLKTSIKYGFYEIILHGRADGVILEDPVVIDEIKSTNSALIDFNDKNEEWHLGQAECYAYMYSKIHNLKRINIRLTYISQNNRKHFAKLFEYNFNELEIKILHLIERYIDFYEIIEEKKKVKENSIKSLVFPFSLRKGQSEIIKVSEESIIDENCRFIEASTGLGKTISVIFGALKGSLKAKTDKLFFLCAKNSGFKSANDCLNKLRENGLSITSCEIIAKEKMCLNKNHGCLPECNPDVCPFAMDYYTKLSNVFKKIICENDCFNSERIKEIADQYGMCPFELSLDISLYCDFITCDYNYVFNPISYLKRFFDELDYKYSKYLMIDEAHNLLDRSRDMFSTSISYKGYKKAKKDYEKIKTKSMKETLKILDEDFELFNKFQSDSENLVLETIDQNFIEHLQKFKISFQEYQKKHPKFKIKYSKEFSLDVHKFLTIYEFLDDNYRIYFNRDAIDNFSIVFKCIDASRYLKDRIDNCEGTVLFSGTLTPIDYYKRILLGSDEYDSIELISPFEKSNLEILVNSNISTKYKDRINTLDDVIENINSFVSYKKGNYIIYVPSFEYLRLLKFRLSNSRFKVIYQDELMSNDDKSNFLNMFKPNPSETTIGICVLGGSFSEGIDLVADRLIGVVIVGVGLPSVNFDNNLIKEYYSNNGLDGYTFAYVNPGINKVMQAVGRLIRGENDRGVALLIDERYSYKTYKFLFDEKWGNHKFINSNDSLLKELNSFYKE